MKELFKHYFSRLREGNNTLDSQSRFSTPQDLYKNN